MRRARGRLEIDWADVFGTRSSSPDSAGAFYLGAAAAARAAKNGGDEPRRGVSVSNRRHLPGIEDLPSRTDGSAGERRRPAPRPSTDAAAKVRSSWLCIRPADLICSNSHSI